MSANDDIDGIEEVEALRAAVAERDVELARLRAAAAPRQGGATVGAITEERLREIAARCARLEVA